jgi:hypothetical protein
MTLYVTWRIPQLQRKWNVVITTPKCIIIIIFIFFNYYSRVCSNQRKIMFYKGPTSICSPFPEWVAFKILSISLLFYQFYIVLIDSYCDATVTLKWRHKIFRPNAGPRWRHFYPASLTPAWRHILLASEITNLSLWCVSSLETIFLYGSIIEIVIFT